MTLTTTNTFTAEDLLIAFPNIKIEKILKKEIRLYTSHQTTLFSAFNEKGNPELFLLYEDEDFFVEFRSGSKKKKEFLRAVEEELDNLYSKLQTK